MKTAVIRIVLLMILLGIMGCAAGTTPRPEATDPFPAGFFGPDPREVKDLFAVYDADPETEEEINLMLSPAGMKYALPQSSAIPDTWNLVRAGQFGSYPWVFDFGQCAVGHGDFDRKLTRVPIKPSLLINFARSLIDGSFPVVIMEGRTDVPDVNVSPYFVQTMEQLQKDYSAKYQKVRFFLGKIAPHSRRIIIVHEGVIKAFILESYSYTPSGCIIEERWIR